MEITNINQLDLNGTYSFADYLTWKFTETVELLRGKIARMAASIWQHQSILGEIHLELGFFLRNKPCRLFIAPTDVRLPRKTADANEQVFTVVQPDIFVLCNENKQYSKLNGWVGIPDLVVEIVSPSTRKRDLYEKKEIYEEAGVREYWVVFPLESMLFQFVLENRAYSFPKILVENDLVQCAIFPDFILDLQQVFKALEE